MKARLYEDDTQDRYFHLYFNPSKHAAERERLELTLDRFKIYMDKHIGDVVTSSKACQEYFTLKYDKAGHLVGYSERKDVIKRELDLCGYFCIVTSEEMTASQALIHYKGRDVSEKLFSADKSFIGSKSMRVQTTQALSAKIFVEFIALIVRNRMYNLLKETMLRLETKPNYMTVPAALRELEKIEMVRRGNNGHYRLDHAVTKKQKTILSAFGLSDTDVKSIAVEIGNQLSGEQTPTDKAPEEDDDYGEDTFTLID